MNEVERALTDALKFLSKEQIIAYHSDNPKTWGRQWKAISKIDLDTLIKLLYKEF